MEKLNQYFDQEAKRMRQQGIDNFGNQFRASRRIIEV